VCRRYLAICYPLGHRVTRRVARIVIAAIWCSACVLLSPWAAYYEQSIYAETDLQTVYVCGQFGWPNEHVMRGYFLGVIVVSCYTLPLVLVTVCYTLIGCRVWHRDAKEIANASQVLSTISLNVVKFYSPWRSHSRQIRHVSLTCVMITFDDTDGVRSFRIALVFFACLLQSVVQPRFHNRLVRRYDYYCLYRLCCAFGWKAAWIHDFSSMNSISRNES